MMNAIYLYKKRLANKFEIPETEEGGMEMNTEGTDTEEGDREG